MFFVPLEKNDLLDRRMQLTQSPKWREKFGHFSLEGFIADHDVYYRAIEPLFTCENQQGIYGKQPRLFNHNELAGFFMSWMQEVRQLPDPEDKRAYVNDLIDSIQESNDPCPDVKAMLALDGQRKIQFVERYSWFHLQNKLPEDITNNQGIADLSISNSSKT